MSQNPPQSGSPQSHQSTLDLLKTEWHRKTRLAIDAEAAALKDPAMLPEARRLAEEAIQAHVEYDLIESAILTNPPGAFENFRFRLTDYGNAEVLAALYRDVLRYDAIRDRWLWWNRHRWNPLPDAILMRFAQAAIRKRRNAALGEVDDRKEQMKVGAMYDKFEADRSLRALLSQARSIQGLTDTGEWDTNPYLLGVANGVVDLRNGDFRPGQPGDRITMSTGIEYDPAATCPRWETFVQEVVPEGSAAWMKRLVGYFATGSIDEHLFAILLGPGGTGKTVFLYLIRVVLGIYGHVLRQDALLASYGKDIRRIVIDLEGKRFAISLESNRGARLDEALLKTLSGDPILRGAQMYSGEREIPNHVTVALATNHPPRLSSDDSILRRLVVLPFTHKPPKENQQLLRTLLSTEAAGILKWIVEGAMEWYAHRHEAGLVESMPESCRKARDEYLVTVNPVFPFLESDFVVLGPGETVQASSLYSAYRQWTQGNGHRPLSSTNFGNALASMREKDGNGAEVKRLPKKKDRDTGRWFYVGIGLAEGVETIA